MINFERRDRLLGLFGDTVEKLWSFIFAKKMPMFEPERVESKERPLAINLDLALYRAKLLARRTFQYEKAESLLRKVWCPFFFMIVSETLQ